MTDQTGYPLPMYPANREIVKYFCWPKPILPDEEYWRAFWPAPAIQLADGWTWHLTVEAWSTRTNERIEPGSATGGGGAYVLLHWVPTPTRSGAEQAP